MNSIPLPEHVGNIFRSIWRSWKEKISAKRAIGCVPDWKENGTPLSATLTSRTSFTARACLRFMRT